MRIESKIPTHFIRTTKICKNFTNKVRIFALEMVTEIFIIHVNKIQIKKLEKFVLFMNILQIWFVR